MEARLRQAILYQSVTVKVVLYLSKYDGSYLSLQELAETKDFKSTSFRSFNNLFIQERRFGSFFKTGKKYAS